MVLFNRKDGVVFTILSLVISSFILLMFFYMIELPVDHGVEVVRIRIHSVNNFLSQSEDLVRAQAVVSSKQTISYIISRMHSQNQFPGNFDVMFIQCLETGYYSGISCGSHANFKGRIENNLSNFLKETSGLNVVFTVDDILLNQSSPWELDILFSLNMFLEDGYFEWDVSLNVSESFSIVGFPDPVHVVVVPDLIHHRPLSLSDVTRISFDENFKNVSDDFLEEHATLNRLLKNKSYFEYADAPSFLDRLRGNMTPSNLGIMTVVLPIYTTLGDYGTAVRRGSSSIDWHFWRDINYPGLYGIYNFTRIEDKVNILVLSAPYYDLTDTIHNAIIPTSLADAANLDGSTYFHNYP